MWSKFSKTTSQLLLDLLYSLITVIFSTFMLLVLIKLGNTLPVRQKKLSQKSLKSATLISEKVQEKHFQNAISIILLTAWVLSNTDKKMLTCKLGAQLAQQTKLINLWLHEKKLSYLVSRCCCHVILFTFCLNCSVAASKV